MVSFIKIEKKNTSGKIYDEDLISIVTKQPLFIADISVKTLISRSSERTEAFQRTGCMLTETFLGVRVMLEIFKLMHSGSSFDYTSHLSCLPSSLPLSRGLPRWMCPTVHGVRSALGSPAGFILNPDFT